MTLYFRQQGSAIIVYGNTYPVRERLKALGAKFNGADKNWRMPHSDEALATVEGLCKALGGAQIGASGEVDATLQVQVQTETTIVAATTTAAGLFGDHEASGRRGAVASARSQSPAAPAAAATPDESGLSIRQLMDRAGLALTQAFPRAVWVVGEIQNAARRPSGLFFDLAEPAAEGQHQNATVTVRAILWRNSLAMIAGKRGATVADDIIQDGMKVRVLVQVQLYRDRGQISLTIDDIDPAFTKGALALAREKLLKELRAKGLDAAQAKLPLPPFPFSVGLISADGSRAKSDFLDQLQALKFPGEILFHNAPMQGEAVPVRVVAAIAALAAHKVDLIVLTRGGGSAADLRWFDAPEIAYAIAHCPVPVVAAIGHHDDVCVAEMVCHLRQKTPTAAADFVAGLFVATRQRIDQLAGTMAKELTRRSAEFNALQAQISGRLAAAASEGLARRDQRLASLASRLGAGAADDLARRGQRLSSVKNGLSANATAVVGVLARQVQDRLSALQLGSERALNVRGAALQSLEQKLIRLDPKPWLEQGWTQLFVGKKGVRSVKDLKPGDRVRARLVDGRAELTVESINDN